jgi:sucrose phosphorylase
VHSFLGTPSDRAAAEASGIKRDINRSQVGLREVSGSPVMKRLSDLIHLRGQQAAFHPNATQYTLHLGDALFGFWRQSRDRSQSIFAVHNLTGVSQDLHPDSLNLTVTEGWVDLLSGRPLAHGGDPLVLAPYQSAWITNRG